MLHFDSHPDLQIDTNMPADIIFDKHQLFDVLSIENWIMPAIYAGHLGHVTWVKPPWADQLPEGSRKVKVGKDRSSGKLRVNWPDSYFVSDLLFAPQEDMENGKDAVVDVVTMETECLRSKDFTFSPSVRMESRCTSFLSREKGDQDMPLRVKKGSVHAGVETQSKTLLESGRGASVDLNNAESESRTFYDDDERGSSTAGLVQNKVETQRMSLENGNDPCSQSNVQLLRRTSSESGNAPSNDRHDHDDVESDRDAMKSDKMASSSYNNEQDINSHTNCPTQQISSKTEIRNCNQHHDSVANLNERDSEHEINISEDRSSLCSIDSNDQQTTDNTHQCNSSEITPNSIETGTCVANLGRGQVQGSRAPSFGTCDTVIQDYSEFSGKFILDIDLDFFSTRNPFKQMYTKEQYNLMDELYRFAAPTDESVPALKACQRKRGKQISELSAGLKAAFNGDGYDALLGDRETFIKITELVKSLQSTPHIEPECLDPEMVHMAGLTCDDHGELPHHVSSDEEIDSLIATTRELLEELPAPTMVTISRSSHDDYCPAHQVDGIQCKVIKMLHSLYDKLDIHLEYEAD
ncbi:UPF0489 protein C5orf22 homolog isoform X2 [Lytechinus variegatus]|nr:UPF0489 protein C5orf22 homolog isoform X2 [Lytechinus variegatus]XP_041471880.1 UPF0489 protein C5orf22 homolog isoform X2 [Lytechinus variegatus]